MEQRFVSGDPNVGHSLSLFLILAYRKERAVLGLPLLFAFTAGRRHRQTGADGQTNGLQVAAHGTVGLARYSGRSSAPDLSPDSMLCEQGNDFIAEPVRRNEV